MSTNPAPETSSTSQAEHDHPAPDKPAKGRFQPKTPVTLDPPRDDPVTVTELARCDGVQSDKVYVAIKGLVYDVSKSPMYKEGQSYHVFAGRDASRALALTSTKPEDVRPEYEDLEDKEQETLNNWITFFEKRYNVVGKVVKD